MGGRGWCSDNMKNVWTNEDLELLNSLMHLDILEICTIMTKFTNGAIRSKLKKLGKKIKPVKYSLSKKRTPNSYGTTTISYVVAELNNHGYHAEKWSEAEPEDIIACHFDKRVYIGIQVKKAQYLKASDVFSAPLSYRPNTKDKKGKVNYTNEQIDFIIIVCYLLDRKYFYIIPVEETNGNLTCSFYPHRNTKFSQGGWDTSKFLDNWGYLDTFTNRAQK